MFNSNFTLNPKQRAAKDEATKYFLQPTASAEAIGETTRGSENFIGWGIGKNASGEDTVLVHVQEKFEGIKIPKDFKGLPTEIVEVGKVTAYQNPTERHRPACAGVSIGHSNITSGTLGCLVKRNGNHYILSNNHILAATNTATVGDPVVQPGPEYGGSSSDNVIATLEEYHPIDFSKNEKNELNPNKIDAAIAKVGDCHQTVVAPEIIGIGLPRSTPLSDYVQDPRGRLVRKYGATTEETIGVVTGASFTVKMGYNVNNKDCKARFEEQISIEGIGPKPFSEGGDSGALIVDSETLKPVALLFGGSNEENKKVTYANPIDLVLECFGVTIVGVTIVGNE